MSFRKISLFLLASLAILIVFNIPFYNHWYTSKFGDEVNDIIDQSQHLSSEERMEYRFGRTYVLLRNIKQKLLMLNAQNAMVLLPPKSYITAMKLYNEQFDVPEPAVFYYFTGFKAVNCNSTDAGRANWVLLSENHKVAMRHVNDVRFLDSMIKTFKSYPN